MSTIQTIVVLLFGSALLQGIAFYIYSNFYKKKHLQYELGDAATLKNSAPVDYKKYMLPLATQPWNKKAGIEHRTNRPQQRRSALNALQPNTPVVSISSKPHSFKQQSK